jgi:hypothetical protein
MQFLVLEPTNIRHTHTLIAYYLHHKTTQSGRSLGAHNFPFFLIRWPKNLAEACYKITGIPTFWNYVALGYGLEDRDSRVRFPAGAVNFSLHHRIQNGSGAHPASYPMGIGDSFAGRKATVVWSWPLTI